jgi:hypothetical protein
MSEFVARIKHRSSEYRVPLKEEADWNMVVIDTAEDVSQLDKFPGLHRIDSIVFMSNENHT